jgi:nucleoside-diphosphate-sugar epimerase
MNIGIQENHRGTIMSETKKILLTGGSGYIGSSFINLFSDEFSILSIDTNYYSTPEIVVNSSVINVNKDIRDISEKDLEGIDYIVHMAELSNDPLGEYNPNLTKSINIDATKDIINLAKNSNIKKFIYMSSCSVYGFTDDLILNEDSDTNPLTEYAKAKVTNERYLLENDYDFEIKILRNATAFGFSPNTRLDLVVNDLSFSAINTSKIEVHSDGTPKRPLVHVEDICRVIYELIVSDESHVLLVNVGSDHMNYSVKEIAQKISEITGVKNLSFGEKDNDQRSYMVDFSKLKEVLPSFEFKHDLESGAIDLIENIQQIKSEINARRIRKIKNLIEEDKLDTHLYWK